MSRDFIPVRSLILGCALAGAGCSGLGGGTPRSAESVAPAAALVDPARVPLEPLASAVGPGAELGELRAIEDVLRAIDLTKPPARLAGPETFVQTEWPLFTFVYFALAAIELARAIPHERAALLGRARWAIATAATCRIAGFASRHACDRATTDVSLVVDGQIFFAMERYAAVSGEAAFGAERDRLAYAFTEAYAHAPEGTLPSYPHLYFVSDNFPALAALTLHAHHAVPAASRFIATIRAHATDPETGLFAAYYDPVRQAPLGPPRGSGTFSALPFAAVIDAVFAAEQAEAAKRRLVRTLGATGLVGAREYPEGHDAPADMDSGRIVLGFGESASGFAIAAFGATGDAPLAAELAASATRVGDPQWRGDRLVMRGMPPVGQAVVLFGKTLVHGGFAESR